MDTIARIKDELNDILQAYPSLFLVEADLKGARGNQKLVITLDGDQGVKIDDCASISRQLSSWIETENLIQDKYLLEVSSAGMTRPLKLKRQYQRHVGKKVLMTMKTGKELSGRLKAVDPDVLVETETGDQALAFEEIDKTTLIISF